MVLKVKENKQVDIDHHKFNNKFYVFFDVIIFYIIINKYE